MKHQRTESCAARNGAPVPVAQLVAGAVASLTQGNPHRITPDEALRCAGITLEEAASDSIVPACCKRGCQVEPDGHCEHACPSVLLALRDDLLTSPTGIVASTTSPRRPVALRVGNLPPAERPHDRLRTLGAAALTTPELIAILLGEAGNRSPAVGVGHELIEATGGSIRRLATESSTVLQRVHGIGPRRIDRLRAACELAHRLATETEVTRPRITSPIDITMLYALRLRDLPFEEFHVAALDTQNGVARDICVSRGLLSSSPVHTREVFYGAIEARAAAVILVHNHPSGDPTPSPEDRVLTQDLHVAGRLLDIPIYDHVIIGRGRYVSFREEGWL
jgi:DNA repair protein RadC